MKDQILKLIEENPKNVISMIKKRPKLQLWVERNCDPLCIEFVCKVYTAITDEKILCPCGSGKLRKLRNLKTGFFFCGTAKNCSACKNSVVDSCVKAAKLWDKESAKIKRAVTNKLIYGVENVGQTSKAIATREKLYKNKERVQTIVEMFEQTCMKKYGVKNPLQVSAIRKKMENTNLTRYGFEVASKSEFSKRKAITTNFKKYGVNFHSQSDIIKDKTRRNNFEKYGIEYIRQAHYTELAKKTLFNKENFVIGLQKYGAELLANILGTSKTNIYTYHKKYDLDIIKSSGSSYETAIENWLVENNIVFFKNDRKAIAPSELDFYIPSYNLAIEFDGLYWHSEANGKDRNYHLQKTQQCEARNIRLIHIFEDEWVNKTDICIDLLSRLFGINQTKIMARKCVIKELKNYECKEFLDDNHLQGYTSASVNVGLFYNNDLVQLLTFKHARYNKNIEWEIIRQINKKGTQIIGGLQKLWSYFLKIYEPVSVVSYCDRRWFLGESYLKLGFVKHSVNRPQYWYFNNLKRFHRSNFTKKRCVNLAKEFEDENILKTLTERTIARDILGFNKIWDCGQDSWIWKE
jgi:hypothetical protein